MNKRSTYCCIALLFPFIVLGQPTVSDCLGIKTGNFYFYPSDSQKQFLISRNGLIQKEIDVNTGDTSFWKVIWRSPCICTLKFLRGNQPMSNEKLLFLNSHQTTVEVLKVTKDYYVFKGRIDSIIGSVSDTIWLKKKMNLTEEVIRDF